MERVTNLFYERYVEVFEEAEHRIGAITRFKHRAQLRLFTQTLFNRLLFLRFLELKHWLEFEGRHDYLQALFAAGGVRGKSVYASRLVPLFRALAGEPLRTRRLIGKVPALAGGPFRETGLDRQARDVPDDVLTLLLDEQGLFYDFRFTIDESAGVGDSLAVDPEMLGTVFEELVTGRNESGAYYTPRPVVSFMCREALKCFLTENTPVAPVAICRLIDCGTIDGLDANAARHIEAALDGIQAVDPACGSGAYLVGLLYELVDLRTRLSKSGLISRKQSRCDLKRRIIGTNLYGADIDPLATHIARLRLWLSLAVDAELPCDLPNLEDRIATGDALTGAFPAALPPEGCDLVLANPPYVRQELIGRTEKRNLQKRYGAAVDGKSDLYCCFFARSQELLREGGVHVCISSGSWLDVAFGARLQEFLLSQAQILAVYDSLVERQFASAAINTVISVVRKRPPEDSPPTRFITFQAPLEVAGREPAARRELTVPRDQLWEPCGQRGSPVNGRRPYRGGKWSGRYLRAPDSYLELQQQAAPLVRLEDSGPWSIGRGRRTGCDDFFYLTVAQAREWNIERRFLKPLVKSPVQFRSAPPYTSHLAREWFVFLCHADNSQLRGTRALRYIRHGERSGVPRRNLTTRTGHWYDLGRQTIPDLILPIAFHERFFVIANDARAQVHQRFATIAVDRGHQTLVPALAAVLSSSLVVLLAEVLGRHGLGQGALDFPPDDWRGMLIPDVVRIDPSDRAELVECWKCVAARAPLPFAAAIHDPAQRRLDGIVARLIGRDECFMDSVRRDALAMIETRLAKARRAGGLIPSDSG